VDIRNNQYFSRVPPLLSIESFYLDALINEAAPDLLVRARAKGLRFVHEVEQSRSINEEKQRKDMTEALRNVDLRDQTRRSPKTEGTSSQIAKQTPKSAEVRRIPEPAGGTE
jgi:hypothetical protein